MLVDFSFSFSCFAMQKLVPWKFHPKLRVKGPKVGAQWTLLGASTAALLRVGGTDGLGIENGFAFFALVVLAAGIMAVFSLRRQSRRGSYTVVGQATFS